MKVLHITNMYSNPKNHFSGIFIKEQIEAIKEIAPTIDQSVLFMDTEQNKLNYVKGLWEVFTKSLINKYDLIHAHYGFSRILARVQFTVPVVVTYYGSDLNIPWQRVISWLAALGAKKVIVQTHLMKKKLGRNGAYVIPCGVNMTLFDVADKELCRKKLGIPPDRELILFPGDRKKRLKHYNLFIKSVNLAKKIDNQIEAIELKNIPRQKGPG